MTAGPNAASKAGQRLRKTATPKKQKTVDASDLSQAQRLTKPKAAEKARAGLINT